MEYNKARGGKWTDTKQLKDGMRAKIMDECVRSESEFKDKEDNPKIENIAKVRFEGLPEATNTRLNWTTIYALIDAHGKDSKLWIDKVLTVRLVRAMVGDTMRTLVYLVPEGFELAENSEGKLEIRKQGGIAATADEADQSPKEEINPDDIPF
jgi:hypothetical protein